jgi:hypothetical protein
MSEEENGEESEAEEEGEGEETEEEQSEGEGEESESEGEGTEEGEEEVEASAEEEGEEGEGGEEEEEGEEEEGGGGQFPTYAGARPSDALGGRAWLEQLGIDVHGADTKAIEKRDNAIVEEIARGNVPDFCRQWIPIHLTDDKGNTGEVQVLCDVLAIGSNEDYLRVPIAGYSSQRIADRLGCFLPTQKIHFEAYAQASVKMVYHNLDCQSGGAGGMYQISNLALRWHDDIVQGRVHCGDAKSGPVAQCAGKFNPLLDPNTANIHKGRCTLGREHPGTLVVGHKKEVVISHEQNPDAKKGGFRGGHTLSFFGFWNAQGTPDQGYFQCAHFAGFTDYAQGTRLVHPKMKVNGQTMNYADVLQSKDYCGLVITTQPGKFAQPSWYPYTVIRYPDPVAGRAWPG